MKRQLLLIAGFVTLVIFAANSVSFAGPIRKREKHQQQRINQGVQSGQLTSREAARLEKGEAHIEKERQRMLEDGKLTPKEAKKLTHDQNVLSKKIYHEKHDKQVREGVTPATPATPAIPATPATPASQS